MEQRLKEGNTEFFTDSEENITADMPIFYNPVMKLNRDLSLAVLMALNAEREEAKAALKQEWKGLRIALPMEASGIRAARILNECKEMVKIRLLAVNDISPSAIQYARRNVALHSSAEAGIEFSSHDASVFLLTGPGFDYVDIDPFGTPNPFLDAAAQNVVNGGILAVTATDTSALAGTYPHATARKYWATPSRTWLMHDAGLRILARKVQLIGAQYEKALIPVLAVATDHYYRIFFRCERGNSAVKAMLKQHKWLRVCTGCMHLVIAGTDDAGTCTCGKEFHVAGPLWRGPLHDVNFVKRCRLAATHLDKQTGKELDALLAIIEDECKVDMVGFIDLRELASRLKTQAPKTADMLALLGPHGCRTHINGAGVKTDLSIAELTRLLSRKNE